MLIAKIFPRFLKFVRYNFYDQYNFYFPEYIYVQLTL
jgi:hypothetical protein